MLQFCRITIFHKRIAQNRYEICLCAKKIVILRVFSKRHAREEKTSVGIDIMKSYTTKTLRKYYIKK